MKLMLIYSSSLCVDKKYKMVQPIHYKLVIISVWTLSELTTCRYIPEAMIHCVWTSTIYLYILHNNCCTCDGCCMRDCCCMRDNCCMCANCCMGDYCMRDYCCMRDHCCVRDYCYMREVLFAGLLLLA